LIEGTMLVDYGHSTQHAAARVLWVDSQQYPPTQPFFIQVYAFQAFGSAKFFWGRTQTRCSQGRAPHDMVCPPSQKS